VLRWAYLNAAFQTGLANPLDEAIPRSAHPIRRHDKLEEIPYDFTRKRLSVVVDSDPGTEIKPMLITKGALDNILSICTRLRVGETVAPLDRSTMQPFTHISRNGANRATACSAWLYAMCRARRLHGG